MIRQTLLLLALLAIAKSGVAQSPRSSVDEASIRADMQQNRCNNGERLEAVKTLFRKMGAAESELKVERVDKVENLVVVKKGKTEETIVIGAHYDKVADGCGAIDNWTGVVIIVNLYGTLRSVSTEKTMVFVAFGKEEDGLIGSRAMAKSIPEEKRPHYCAMLNFDSFGLYYPQVLSNSSSSRMTKFAKELAAEVKMPFHDASLAGVADSDSSSFLSKDIPAITFHGMSSKWSEVLHTSKDKLENVNHAAVLVAYNFAALYLSRVDARPCNSFRK